jgi:hypothetical protein
MYHEHEPSPIDVSPLHRAMRRAYRADAVIRTEPDRIVIEFSDGRTHRIPRAHDIAADQLLAAAVHWCRRHGADVVDIRA